MHPQVAFEQTYHGGISTQNYAGPPGCFAYFVSCLNSLRAGRLYCSDIYMHPRERGIRRESPQRNYSVSGVTNTRRASCVCTWRGLRRRRDRRNGVFHSNFDAQTLVWAYWGLAVAGGGGGRHFLQTPLCHRMFDAVGQLRAGAGAGGHAAGFPDLGEVGAALRRIGVPLHRRVLGPKFFHAYRDMAEPAVDGNEPRGQIALAVTLGGLP